MSGHQHYLPHIARTPHFVAPVVTVKIPAMVRHSPAHRPRVIVVMTGSAETAVASLLVR